MDCKGHAAYRYDPVGRNIGSVEFVRGGVGRNVAVNMAHLGVNVTLLSSVDNNALGNDLINSVEECGINSSYIAKAENSGMGLWLAVMDQSGELVSSISQMPDTSYMEKMFDEHGEELVKNSDAIILEIDLNVSLVRKVLSVSEKYGKKVYSLPANMETALSNRGLLEKLECFICNDIEVGRLFERDLRSLTPNEVLAEVAEYAPSIGIPIFIVTLAERGSVYYDTVRHTGGVCSVVKANVVDSSGAGDAFFAGTVAGIISGLDLDHATNIGSEVASETVSISDPVCTSFPSGLVVLLEKN